MPARKKCPHGRQKSQCRECGGAGICEHGRRRSECGKCGGASICEHDRVRNRCKACGGASMCEHDRLRSHCKACGGASMCEHGRRRNTCKQCGGASICEHGRERSRCKDCDPNGYLRQLLATRLRTALKHADLSKERSTLDLLGVTSAAEVWEHLQKQPTYEPWMTLDNLGALKADDAKTGRLVWQIDHIIPIAYPGSGTPEGGISADDMARRMHFTNLQPLRAVDNVSKGNRRVGA